MPLCSGRLDPSQRITLKDIHESNVCGKVKHGVKLLGGGVLTTPIDIEVCAHTPRDFKSLLLSCVRAFLLLSPRTLLPSHPLFSLMF